MVSRMSLFGLILGIPLLGLAVAKGIQAYLNLELRSVIRKQYPNADQGAIAQITLDRICEKPNAGLRDICGTNANHEPHECRCRGCRGTWPRASPGNPCYGEYRAQAAKVAALPLQAWPVSYRSGPNRFGNDPCCSCDYRHLLR